MVNPRFHSIIPSMDNILLTWIGNAVHYALKLVMPSLLRDVTMIYGTTDRNCAKNCSKKPVETLAQAPHDYHYLMKCNQCIVWVHLLKFLEHWCDVHLPKSFILQVCVTLSLSRESCSTCLIQNSKDYTPNCVISWLALLQNLDKQRRALCCKPDLSRDWAYLHPWRLRRRKQ